MDGTLLAVNAEGTAATWKVSGNEQDFAETIYVNDKTGRPVTVRYVVRHGRTPAAGFGHWSSTSAVTRPAQVVAG